MRSYGFFKICAYINIFATLILVSKGEVRVAAFSTICTIIWLLAIIADLLVDIKNKLK